VGCQWDSTKENKSILRSAKAFRTAGFQRWAFGCSLNECMKGGKAIKTGILDRLPYRHLLPDRNTLLGPAICRVEDAFAALAAEIPTVATTLQETRSYLQPDSAKYVPPSLVIICTLLTFLAQIFVAWFICVYKWSNWGECSSG
jgi:hypothetical protein